MTIEATLERIAAALEKLVNSASGATPITQAQETTKPEKELLTEEKIKAPQKDVETKTQPEKEKPKFDFNKEIREPFVALLLATKDHPQKGPKAAKELGYELLSKYSTDPNTNLSAKTLPEDKYDDFLAAVEGHMKELKALG